MAQTLAALRWATDAAFVLLALASIRQYQLHPKRQQLDLAAAILLLTLVAISGRATALLPKSEALYATDAVVVFFMASGYAFLRFRSEFIPLPRLWEVVAIVGVAAITGFAIAVGLPQSGVRTTPIQQVATLLLVGGWSVCVGEPIVRFWMASRRRPPVQRRRLRTLAGGYLALILVLLVAGFLSGRAIPVWVSLAISVVSLLSVPLIYAGFSPPAWLRRLWRESEEEAFRQATRDLLLFSPTRRALGTRASEWAVRLMGGDAAFIADWDGGILATAGMSEERAAAVLKLLPDETEQPVEITRTSTAVRFPLVSPGRSPGALVVLGGPFTPFFGTDELLRLEQYAVNTAAGLDRASLTERLAALERTKTEFLNLASHELRAPLTVIRGYLSMLGEGTLGPLTGEVRQIVPVLIEKADQMNRLVEQMLEASRLEEGRLELKLEAADLRELVKAAIEETRPFTDTSHAVKFDEPRESVVVRVDRQRVTSIVTNLISNAIKYSPQGGKVDLSISRDGTARVAVRDEGVGIATDDLSQLFTRFGRITTPETRNVPGTGLGLYLSRELARLHGGDLTVKSEPGAGSTFTLDLPLEASS